MCMPYACRVCAVHTRWHPCCGWRRSYLRSRRAEHLTSSPLELGKVRPARKNNPFDSAHASSLSQNTRARRLIGADGARTLTPGAQAACTSALRVGTAHTVKKTRHRLPLQMTCATAVTRCSLPMVDAPHIPRMVATAAAAQQHNQHGCTAALLCSRSAQRAISDMPQPLRRPMLTGSPPPPRRQLR